MFQPRAAVHHELTFGPMRRRWWVLLLALTGCQRGCLSAWIAEKADPSASSDPRERLMGFTDCSDGLVRCHAGIAQRSVGVAIPQACHSTPDNPHACDCPFAPVTTCADGCVAEDVTLVSADAKRACAPPKFELVSTEPHPPLVTTCEGEGTRFRCEKGAVFACADAGAEPIGACSRGCAVEGEQLDDEEVDLARAIGLLCVATRNTL